MPAHTPLWLASSSPFRRALLERLRVPFETRSPEIDESPAADEMPRELAIRLAREKAGAIASPLSDAIVIGSDQIALRDGEILGKPGTADRARQQLTASSGRTVDFLTAWHVMDVRSGESRSGVDETRVVFRALGREEIDRYVAAEQPLGSAGSFQAESLGITLFDRVDSVDPTALVGLPLISVAAALREFGYALP